MKSLLKFDSTMLSSGRAFALMTMITAFFIPVLKSGIQIPIILLLLTWIFTPKGNGAANGWPIIVFIGIFIFHILGMVYTDDRGEGLIDMEQKMSLVLFPLLFGTVQPFEQGNSRKVLNAFGSGVIVALLIAFFDSMMQYLESGELIRFYTSSFSPVHHPSYIAMYMNLALVIWGVRLYEKGKSKKYRTIIMIAMVFVALSLVFPASKMGFINFVFVIVFLLFKAWKAKALFSKSSLFLVLLFFSFFAFLKLNPVASGRVEASVKVNTGQIENPPSETESNQARRIAWKVASEVIIAHPFGVGTGDVGAVMDQAYLDRGYDALAEKSLNPHNSFLQLAVGLGIIALLWFLFSLIYPFPTIYKNHLWIYGFFLLSIGLNFMVESMLEKQSGVIFFAFFNSFFYFLNPSVKRE